MYPVARLFSVRFLYLGEINDSQRESWHKTVELFEDGRPSAKTMALFPEHHSVAINNEDVVQIRLKDMELHRPRQWGACWLSCRLYKQLGLDKFWLERLPPSRMTSAKFGYSREKRFGCVQVVIGLIVTPEGFPLAYEVMSGNTADKTTLRDFLQKIESQYGKAERIWVMDRGIPTEEVLQEMRANCY